MMDCSMATYDRDRTPTLRCTDCGTDITYALDAVMVEDEQTTWWICAPCADAAGEQSA